MHQKFTDPTLLYPNFLYIGARKAGSSWIYEVLRQHPEVFVPVAKDIRFFDQYYNRGLDWYLSFFKEGAACPARGELWHNYFLTEKCADRIKRHLPDVRLLCCLREPVDMILSNYLYSRTLGLDRQVSLEDFARRQWTRRQCDYYWRLLPFFQRFPPENILVLFFDDLKQEPAVFAEGIFRFLRVDPNATLVDLDKRVLPATQPRNVRLAYAAFRVGYMIRSLGLANLVGMVKRDETFRRVMYQKLEKKPAVPPALAAEIRRYYHDSYLRLPELIGRRLPDSWDFQ